MKSEELKKLQNEMSSLNEAIMELLQRKQVICTVLERHWTEQVASQLNKEIEASGYFFDEKQRVTFYAQGTIGVELYPHMCEWWRMKDLNGGWVDYSRAEKLEKIVNATEVITELKKDFPDIRISVKYNYGGSLDDPEPDDELIEDVVDFKVRN